MAQIRYIPLEPENSIELTDIPSPMHYFFNPGEVAYPDHEFWELTTGGGLSNSETNEIHLFTVERVKYFSSKMTKELWIALEDNARNNHDLMPGWHEGFKPHFDKLASCFSSAANGNTQILRISPRFMY